MSSEKHLSTGSKAPPLQKGKLRLYSMRYCPYAQRAHLVLNSKKIPYDVVYINLSQKPEWYQGKVPGIVLENGETLYESLIISEYLDEAYPEHNLFPKDPLAKAKDKLLIEKFNQVSTPLYKVYFGKAEDQDLFNAVLKGLEVFDRELASRGTQFFYGNRPGMLDLMIWPWFDKAEILKFVRGNDYTIPEDRFPELLKWKKSMNEDEGVKKSLVDLESHAKYMKTYVAGATQYDF